MFIYTSDAHRILKALKTKKWDFIDILGLDKIALMNIDFNDNDIPYVSIRIDPYGTDPFYICVHNVTDISLTDTHLKVSGDISFNIAIRYDYAYLKPKSMQ